LLRPVGGEGAGGIVHEDLRGHGFAEFAFEAGTQRSEQIRDPGAAR
jgi:hypothetical protein